MAKKIEKVETKKTEKAIPTKKATKKEVKIEEPKSVNGVTEEMIANYYEVDSQYKQYDKMRSKLGEEIKGLWPDNEMHILGSYSIEKKVTKAAIMDKDVLLKLLIERIGKEEAEELFSLSKNESPRVSLSVKKAAN